MKRHIPNVFTSLNLFFGCVATVAAFNGAYLWVVIWVIIAAFFDFCDGFSARTLKAYSPMGKELDSLADMVSFGVAPSVVVFHLLSEKIGYVSENPLIQEYLPYIAFLLAVCSGLRLAKFNVDKRQSDSFIGLNTPANALFWVSFCYGLMTDERVLFSPGLVYTVLVGIVVFSLLMVSEIPMFSFKIKSLKFRGNEHRYFMVLFMIGLIIFLGLFGISGGILLYIALSIIDSRNRKIEG